MRDTSLIYKTNNNCSTKIHIDIDIVPKKKMYMCNISLPSIENMCVHHCILGPLLQFETKTRAN